MCFSFYKVNIIFFRETNVFHLISNRMMGGGNILTINYIQIIILNYKKNFISLKKRNLNAKKIYGNF